MEKIFETFSEFILKEGWNSPEEVHTRNFAMIYKKADKTLLDRVEIDAAVKWIARYGTDKQKKQLKELLPYNEKKPYFTKPTFYKNGTTLIDDSI